MKRQALPVLIVPLALAIGLLVVVTGADTQAAAKTTSNRMFPSVVADIPISPDPAHITFTSVATTYLPAVTKQYQVLYFDDFSNPNSGWPSYQTENYGFAYRDGEYEVRISRPLDWVGQVAPAGPFDGYSAEVKMRLYSGPGWYYGLIFGFLDGWHFYVFIVGPETQKGAILRAVPTGWVTLVPLTFSSYINGGGAVNHLRVERVGNRIDAYVNNHFFTSTSDSTYTAPGRVGFEIWSTPTSGVVVRVDDFRVEDR